MTEERRPLAAFLYALASRFAPLGELEHALRIATDATPPFTFENAHAYGWACHAIDELDRAGARNAMPTPGDHPAG